MFHLGERLACAASSTVFSSIWNLSFYRSIYETRVLAFLPLSIPLCISSYYFSLCIINGGSELHFSLFGIILFRLRVFLFRMKFSIAYKKPHFEWQIIIVYIFLLFIIHFELSLLLCFSAIGGRVVLSVELFYTKDSGTIELKL